MSTPDRQPTRTPLIALVHRADRELQADMVRASRAGGRPEAKMAHNSVFSVLGRTPARPAELAARAGVTRQSMGEVIRELVDHGIVEMTPDPADRRAKLVAYTDAGLEHVKRGRSHIVDLEERLVDELGEEAYEHLRTGLEKVVAVLGRDHEG